MTCHASGEGILLAEQFVHYLHNVFVIGKHIFVFLGGVIFCKRGFFKGTIFPWGEKFLGGIFKQCFKWDMWELSGIT